MISAGHGAAVPREAKMVEKEVEVEGVGTVVVTDMGRWREKNDAM